MPDYSAPAQPDGPPRATDADPRRRARIVALLRVPFKTRSRVLAVVLALLAGVLWHASWRRPVGPSQGRGLSRAAAEPQPTALGPSIRLATFNIHRGKGADGRRDLARTARALHDVDLAGLNEVGGCLWQRPADQAEDLAGRLEADWLFAPAESRWYGAARFGNALLSRFRVTRWEVIPLPRRHDRSCRNMILATVVGPTGRFRVLVTHVAQRDQREREAQLGAVLELFFQTPPPVVLLGDLNATADDPQLRAALERPGVVDALGPQDAGDGPRVDWILARGMRRINSGRIEEGASDHPLFWAEMELETSP